MKRHFKIALWVGATLMVLGTLASMYLGSLITFGSNLGLAQESAVIVSIFASVGTYFGASLAAGSIIGHLITRDLSHQDDTGR